MKKLSKLLSAMAICCMFVLMGCTGGGTSSPPESPKLTAATSTNVDGSTTVSWTSSDSSIVTVDVEDASNSNLLYTGGPTGSTTVGSNVTGVNLVARNVSMQAVATLLITFGTIPGPPPPPPPPPTEGDVLITVSWTLPTTYADGTTISSDNVAKMIVQVWWKETNEAFTDADTLLVTSQPGASSVQTTIHVVFGREYYFSVRCQIPDDGYWSAFAPVYPYTWQAP